MRQNEEESDARTDLYPDSAGRNGRHLPGGLIIVPSLHDPEQKGACYSRSIALFTGHTIFHPIGTVCIMHAKSLGGLFVVSIIITGVALFTLAAFALGAIAIIGGARYSARVAEIDFEDLAGPGDER